MNLICHSVNESICEEKTTKERMDIQWIFERPSAKNKTGTSEKVSVQNFK